MDTKSIVSKVKSILENNTTLKGYVKDVFIGDRGEGMPATAYPSITIDVLREDLIKVYENGVKEIRLSVRIICDLYTNDLEYSVLGKNSYKGILNFKDDVENALNSYYPDLDRTALYFTFGDCVYSDREDGKGKYADLTINFIYRS